MVFSKAIKIKVWVNRYNESRKRQGFALIVFECEMFSDGKWSVDLKLSKSGVFFSSEMKTLGALAANCGLLFYVGSNDVSPVLHFQ